MKRFNQWLIDRPIMYGLFIALGIFLLDAYYIFRDEPNRLGASLVGAIAVFVVTSIVAAWRKSHRAP